MKADFKIERDDRFNWCVPGVKLKAVFDFRPITLPKYYEYLPKIGETYTIHSIFQRKDDGRRGITLEELPVYTEVSAEPERVRMEIVNTLTGKPNFEPVDDE